MQCESLCSGDSGCKGYVMYDYRTTTHHVRYCQLATTSACPSGCRNGLWSGAIGQLDANAKCSWSIFWDGGCMIKRGWKVSKLLPQEVTKHRTFSEKNILASLIYLINNEYTFCRWDLLETFYLNLWQQTF